MIYTLIFALFAGTHLVSGNPVPQDVAAAVGGIIGIAGAAAAPAAGDPKSCAILESSMSPYHSSFFLSMFLALSRCFLFWGDYLPSCLQSMDLS